MTNDLEKQIAKTKGIEIDSRGRVAGPQYPIGQMGDMLHTTNAINSYAGAKELVGAILKDYDRSQEVLKKVSQPKVPTRYVA